jgi:transcriptional regulator with XRE-family HTH domain
LNGATPTRTFEAAIARATAVRHAKLVEDLMRIREDAGISRSHLAREAGVDRRYLDRIEAGGIRPSIELYQRLATALGADLSTRVYPNTGPLIRDRHQGGILEVTLAKTHPRWVRYAEVAVRRPSRGWIDLVLHDPIERVVVATEIQSELRRLEQLVRWAAEKADGLPSWDGWSQLRDEPVISRLLLVRRTRASRAIAHEFARQLRVAYPAHPDDALASLTGTAPWPGPALVWVVLEGARSRLVSDR